jgi:thymidylate synthase (FAD)
MTEQIIAGDPYFQVEVLEKTPRPQRLIYAAMHQDYSEEFVVDEQFIHDITEDKAGEIITKRLLKHLHYGPLEHPHITFAIGYFPHSVMQQARTHRVAVSFDVQSFRYSGKRILDVIDSKRNVEDVFYVRPLGKYSDRQGKKYEYTEKGRIIDLQECVRAANLYADKIEAGYSEEHARGMIPFDIRQHFVATFNVRSLMHFMDMRFPLDAQYEIRCLCELMWDHFKEWVPDVALWYEANRKGKNKLAP